MKIAVVGNALPLYDPPTRVAEEFAMIDVISGGRLIAGMVVGGGPEYYSFSVNPAHARERFREAHDLIKKAWTEPGPFECVGKHFRIRYVNPWPRPIQQPHPEIWIPGAGSLETIEFVAQQPLLLHGHPVLPHRRVRAVLLDVPRRVRGRGLHRRPAAGRLARADLRGRDRRAGPHGVRGAPLVLREAAAPRHHDPAARLHVGPVARERSSRRAGTFMLNVETWEEIIEGRYAIVGSPETVADTLIDSLGRLGTGNLLGLFQLGSLPARPHREEHEAVRGARCCRGSRAEFPEGAPVYRPSAKVA